MSKNSRWSLKAFQDKKLVDQGGGIFIHADKLTNHGKVDKLPNLLERAFINNPATGKPVETMLDLANAIKENVKPTGNKKIKNATKSVNDAGIKFDSNLERYLYESLQAAGVAFDFQKMFLLQKKFKYGTENVRAITKIVDFWLPTRNLLIDTKGFSNDVSPIKHKMLKFALLNTYGITPEIIMPFNRKEVDALVYRLRFGEFKK